MKFKYSGVTANGDYVSELLEADSESEAYTQLEERGIIVDSLKNTNTLLGGLFKPRVKAKDLIFLCTSMSNMLKAGLGIVDTLKLVMNDSKGNLKQMLTGVHDNVVAGVSLSESFEKLDGMPTIVPGIISMGESTGNFEHSFENLATYFIKKVGLRKKIIGAVSYPAIVFSMGIILINVLAVVALPKMLSAATSFGVKLNPVTRATMAFSTMMRSYGLIFLVLSVLFIGLVVFIVKRYLQYEIDRVKFRLPIIGKLYRKIVSIEFADQFNLLDRAGIRTIDSLELIISLTRNTYAKAEYTTIRDRVLSGDRVSQVMPTDIFDPVVISTLKIGEESGDFGESLTRASDYLNGEVGSVVSATIQLLNPLLLLVVGLIVGIMMYAVMGPMLDMYTQMGAQS